MTWLSRVADAADRWDDRRAARAVGVGEQPLTPGPVAATWAACKLAAVALTSPIGVPIVAGRAAANTAEIARRRAAYPAEIDKVLHGEATSIPAGRVKRLPADGRYFLTSDLHRCVRGMTDWAGSQNTKALYEVALEHYAREEWSLVENGDVEDYWLVGGSTYGVFYDVVRSLALVLPGRGTRDVLRALYLGHLDRIIENNRGIYDRIDELFHARGRYHRVVGNHDDCYLDESVVDLLRAYLPGLEMHDFIAFDGPDGGVGVATHGHHTDAWNAPDRSGLGKLGSWLASALVDAPLLHRNLGLPGSGETEALLEGRHTDLLTVVSPVIGINREFYSVDEVALFAAFRSHFGDDDPLFILGHTHLPLSSPRVPGDRGVWRRYRNSGSGVHHELVTGLEWDGTHDPAAPDVALVGWHYADARTPPEAIVAERDERPIARRRFAPTSESAALAALPASR